MNTRASNLQLSIAWNRSARHLRCIVAMLLLLASTTSATAQEDTAPTSGSEAIGDARAEEPMSDDALRTPGGWHHPLSVAPAQAPTHADPISAPPEAEDTPQGWNMGRILRSEPRDPAGPSTPTTRRDRGLVVEASVGHAWPRGQFGDVFSGGGFNSQAFVAWRRRGLSIGPIFRWQSLENSAVEPVNMLTAGVQTRIVLPWLLRSRERWRIYLGMALHYNWLETCDAGDCPARGDGDFFEHAGLGIDVLTGISVDLHRQDDVLGRRGRFYLFTEVKVSRTWLSNAALGRSIQGPLVLWQGGLGLDIGFQ